MNVWRLVIREISHRKLNFLLGLLSVTVAVACFVGSLTLLEAHEFSTKTILDQKSREVEQSVADRRVDVKKAGKSLNNIMRKIQLGLGFNIFILPKGEDLENFNINGALTETMPEAYVEKLANSKIVTVNHLLPMVTKRLEWEGPLQKQTIIVYGTRGEVPLMHRASKKPLKDVVEPGHIVLGYHVHNKQNLKNGDKLTLLDREFTVSELHPKENSIDDSSVWINLKEAQELLGMQNLIHAILALECNCAAKDRVGQIRAEISELLPGTQVEEMRSKALARAESRTKTKKAADEALKSEIAAGQKLLEREKTHRTALRQQRETLAAILVPLVIVACAMMIGLLAFGNVRQRSAEIGILRAIGLRSLQILSVFLAKAVFVGLLGSAIGYVAGFGVGVAWSDLGMTAKNIADLFAPEMLVLAIVMAPLLSGVASWIPAMLAAGQDPAVILQQE